ncbi:MAG TPA: hypothetical protein VJH65_00745 [Candidatus Nanoarchaeia archaeon]|nr:hypothetical protein [Candidatus Nanoarchaeia archaeon]
MEITEELRFLNHYFGPASCPQKGFEDHSISDKPIELLIENLHKKSIEINLTYSEKEVKYNMYYYKRIYGEKTVIIPLLTKFPNEIKVTPITFYLRNENRLELKLSDYNHKTVEPEEDFICGDVGGYSGIICKLSVKENVESSIIDKVKEAIKETYEINFYISDCQ